MSFTVETGAGLSTANSYISVTDADSYIANFGNSSTWTGATEAEKQEALRIGTQYLDLKYSFRGVKYTKEQALAFPRAGVCDDDGYSVLSDEVPEAIKRACVEAALRHLAGDSLLGYQENPGTIKRERSKVAVIEEEIEYMGGKSQVPRYPKIDALLRGLINDGYTVMRG